MNAPSLHGPLSVLMLGCGNMGAAIASALACTHPSVRITAVDPDVERARQFLLSSSSIDIVAGCGELAECTFDVCLVAVKPQHVAAALQAAGPVLNDALIVSIAAGIPLSGLQQAAPDLRRFVRVMPNLPALAGKAMSVGYSDASRLSAEDRAIVESIFAALGAFRWLDTEAQIDLATGVTGSGPGYVFAFTEHLQHAAERLGFSPELAAHFARETVIGAARLLEQDARSAHDLKVAVTSPGGTTAAGLAILEKPTALPATLAATVKAAADRAAQLAAIQP